MKTALITTTINVPKVLALYRKLGLDVMFFVAADEKTPPEAYQFCADIPDCEIYSPDRQRELGYECSALIGWNNDSRRNIALLEAVKWGADIIVSVDDDMIPLGTDFFVHIEQTLTVPFSGLQCGSENSWFDAGQWTIAPAGQRGLPRDIDHPVSYAAVCDVQIGAMQGTILGIPDTSAAENITTKPFVHTAGDLWHRGFVVDPLAFAVFNSQITAFRRELSPCFAQFYPWQLRNTDIFASLIMRRIMREQNLYTYFGPPVGFHARNEHDPVRDFQAELWGLQRVERFAQFLNVCIMPHVEIVNNLRLLYRAIGEDGMRDMSVCALAFLDDIEKIL